MSRNKKLRVLGARSVAAPQAPEAAVPTDPVAPEGTELVQLSAIEAAHALRAEESALAHAGQLFSNEMQTLARVRASSDNRFTNGNARVLRYPDGRWFFQLQIPAKDGSSALPDRAKESAP